MRIEGVVLAAAVLSTAAPAQQLRWRLPVRGAAGYERQWSAHSAIAESAAAAAALEPHAAVPERYLPRLLPAPWLCQGELDRDQQAIADPPRDLRDVLRAVALDLAARGSAQWRFTRLVPFGDLQLSGSVSALDERGNQSIRATVSRRDPVALPGDGDDLRERHLNRLCATPVTGSLELERSVDVAAGCVRSYRAELTLIVDEGQRRCRKLVLRDAWRLLAVHEPQDADFRARVATAVRRGAAWVAAAVQGLDATWLHDKGRDQGKRSFGSGRVALAALTLLHADHPPQHPAVAAALGELARRRLIDSYSLAVALLATSARFAPPREAELVRDGTLPGRQPRALDEPSRRLAARWLGQLLKNVDPRPDPAQLLRFNYTAGPRCDTSVQQYGLLGLDAASLCGLEVPATAWLAAANHLLAVQCPAHGRSIDLLLTTHRQLAAGERARGQRTPARGFAYQDAEEPPYGSMTAAGITGLVIARAALAGGGAGKSKDLRALDEAVQQAFTWLGAEFAVRSNPGFVGRAQSHWYYWLYCLERACELSGVAHLQGRDWYYEGALQLLAQQQDNGSFRTEDDDNLLLDATCFAILFLKKATLPVVTGR